MTEVEFSTDESRIIGHTDTTLLPEMATRLGLAIGTFFGQQSMIATSRDFRRDSWMLKRALSGGVLGTGVDIMDLHAASTSTLQFVVRRFGASGGVSFTGAHYIDGEVSVRVLDSSGNELERKDLQRIIDIARSGEFTRVPKDQVGIIESVENSTEIYLKALLNFIKSSAIREANYRVVVDCSLGPTALTAPNILSELLVDVVSMNAHLISPQVVLPNPQSIQRVSKAITAIDADLGLILDVEGVKLVALDNEGRLITPEDLTALLIWENLKTRKGTIILSHLYTKRFDEAFEGVGAKIVRAKDTPGNIGRLISQERAIIGATDNGKLFAPVWGAETDGLLSALTLLEVLTVRQMSLSEVMKEFDSKRSRAEVVSRMVTSIPLPDNVSQLKFWRVLNHKAKESGQYFRDTLVGLKIELGSGFGHFMTSLKEREVELIVETSKPSEFASLCDRCQELAREAIEEIQGYT